MLTKEVKKKKKIRKSRKADTGKGRHKEKQQTGEHSTDNPGNWQKELETDRGEKKILRKMAPVPR